MKTVKEIEDIFIQINNKHNLHNKPELLYKSGLFISWFNDINTALFGITNVNIPNTPQILDPTSSRLLIENGAYYKPFIETKIKKQFLDNVILVEFLSLYPNIALKEFTINDFYNQDFFKYYQFLIQNRHLFKPVVKLSIKYWINFVYGAINNKNFNLYCHKDYKNVILLAARNIGEKLMTYDEVVYVDTYMIIFNTSDENEVDKIMSQFDLPYNVNKCKTVAIFNKKAILYK